MDKTIAEYESTIKELKEEIEKLKRKKKYGLVWEEQEEDVDKNKNSIPFLVESVDKRITKDKDSPTNLLIEGDNYDSLKSLLYTHKEKIDVIYIDPPYNTGNKDFVYNDAYVDGDDEWKHSKWLSFMSKRLRLAKELLSDEGAIFISIDDNEMYQLKLLMDKIFGEHNFIVNFIRKNKSGSGHDSSQIAIEYDYMLCYAKDKTNVIFNKEVLEIEDDPKYKFEDEHVDRRGKYYLRDLDYKGSYSKSLDYPIITPDGTQIFSGGREGRPNTWRWSEDKFQWGLDNDFIVFKKRKTGWKVYIKQYQFVDNNDKKRIRTIPYRGLIQFLNSEGSKELREILNNNAFSYPKPKSLLKFVVGLIPNKNATVLDFFAGSGTTGHAVLELNEEDGGNRQFILCTNNEVSDEVERRYLFENGYIPKNNKTEYNKYKRDNQEEYNEFLNSEVYQKLGIAQAVTYERLNKVINGYITPKGKEVEGIPSNLKYYKVHNYKNIDDLTDQDIEEIRNLSTELFVIKEDTHIEEIINEKYAIYSNEEKITAILYDYKYYEEFIEVIHKYNCPKSVYMFTWTNQVYEELVDEVSKKVQQVSFEPIPENILKFYRNNKEVF